MLIDIIFFWLSYFVHYSGRLTSVLFRYHLRNISVFRGGHQPPENTRTRQFAGSTHLVSALTGLNEACKTENHDKLSRFSNYTRRFRNEFFPTTKFYRNQDVMSIN